MKTQLANNTPLASTFSTTPVDMRKSDGFCATISVSTVNAVGQFLVEGAVDETAGPWVPLTQTSSDMLVASADIIYKLNFLQIQDPFIRITYYATSGSGTTIIWFTNKAFSGKAW